MLRALLVLVIACLAPKIALTDTIVAAHTIRAQSILTARDLAFKDTEIAGGVTDPSQIIGKESRVALYAGRPIKLKDLGPPALVTRNQVVQIVFQSKSLNIATEGRSLGRAGKGEYVKVMNLTSRNTVFGVVSADGRVFVSQ
ncbi:MAG: flagellar basal body P-ring formation chaperone FlgA [Pseudomonadota bacterium]